MPKIRKRARGFVEYAAKYHNPVQWAHFDYPDDESIYYHEIRRDGGGPDSWYDVPIWVIPNTRGRDAWGQSSTYGMSNHRSMLRDFPNGRDGLVVVQWSNVDELAIRLDKVSRELLDICQGLLDYPVYDEDDHSALEVDLQGECWDSYGRDDLRLELNRAFPVEADDDDALDEAWWAACQEFNIYAEFELGSCHWRGLADAETLAFIGERLGLLGEC